MASRISDYPLCGHIKTNGRRCPAPALAISAFCRHHQKLHRTRPSTIDAGPGLSTHVLHPLHNATSIQQAIAMVTGGLAANRIHPKIAGRMLFALQTSPATSVTPNRNTFLAVTPMDQIGWRNTHPSTRTIQSTSPQVPRGRGGREAHPTVR